MSVKSRLEKIKKAILGEREVIVAHESLEHRGSFAVNGHDELGLLSEEAVRSQFGDQDHKIIFLVYEDNWRGGEYEREE